MGVSSTEKSRLRRQRIRDGRRLVKTWLSADQIDALGDYGLVGDASDGEELNQAVQMLLRGLCWRGISINLTWCAGDAACREDGPRGIVPKLSERELLGDHRRSMFGRPKSRAALNIEIQPA